MSSRGGKKYRICTDSIAKTAGTPKRSTWSPAAKSRYDRCLKKVDEKQTNEDSPTASRKWGETLRKRKFKPQHGTGGTNELTGKTASNPTVAGKLQVSHTVYARIGGLIRETVGASFMQGVTGKLDKPKDPNKPGEPKEKKPPGILRSAITKTVLGDNPYTTKTKNPTPFKYEAPTT